MDFIVTIAPIVILIYLMTNTVPVSFGAVGTPTWFGLGALQLENGKIEKILFKCQGGIQHHANS
jgi:L-lactate permease